jgi:hypothetical protein
VVFDAVDVLRADHLGGDRGVIATASPDFENPVARGEFQQSSHDGDHVRGAYGLSFPDR